MKRATILVADDHPVVRHGVRLLLESNCDWKVVAEAADGREAVLKARQISPDLAILDLGMSSLNGLEATRRIARFAPQTRILILSMYDSDELIEKAMDAGAHGFVRKSEAETELYAAVRAVLNNKVFFPLTAMGGLRRSRNGERALLSDGLTSRETELLQLIAEGNSNKEVASILGISRRTVENHRARIMRKLGLRTFSELIRYAVRNKLTAA